MKIIPTLPVSLSACVILAAVCILQHGQAQQANPAQSASQTGLQAQALAATHSTTAFQTVQQSIEVTTTVEPMPLSANDRSVLVLDTQAEPLLNHSIEGYLRTDTSLSIQARGGNGVQADLSIRGTTFEQSLVLVNGLRINDPESGHLNLDIPVPLEAISRVDVLHGSGSTFYGSDAIGGAVNLITARPTTTSVIAAAGFGNYGSEEQHVVANYRSHPVTEQLSASRATSDGFIVDRGYHANAISSETWLNLIPAATDGGRREADNWTSDVLLAASDRPYGANQFYGPYDSTERTKGWFASIQQQLGSRTAADFGYLRHTDLFVLFADNPSYYRNNHIATTYEGALRRAQPVFRSRAVQGASLSYGLEADGDAIASTNLGHHARNQGAGYVSLSVPSLGRFSATLGGREEVFSGGDSVFSPNAALAYAASKTVRLRGSVGYGFRLPTYTDLYYSDPSTIGNPNLKPESSWSYEAGLDWNPGGRFTFAATGFRLNQTNSIDYSKYSLAAPWQANNISNLNLTGGEATLRLRLSGTQSLDLGYTGIHANAPPTGLISEYAYNYAAQNARIGWTSELFGQVEAQGGVQVVQRTQHTAYPLVDLAVARSSGRVRPYLRLVNLSNTGYQEIPGVPMQGLSVMAGTEISWSPRGGLKGAKH